MCLAFFFLLRRSEIVAISGNTFKWFALRTEDVAVLDESGMPTACASQAASVTIRLRGSKTNQGGGVTSRLLYRSGHRSLCPVIGVLLLLHARRSLPSNIPVAVYMDESNRPASISTDRLTKAVQHAVSKMDDDPRCFSAHSPRSGGTTYMYRAGVDTMTIQFHGRWASDAFKLYTNLCKESVATLASKLVSGSQGDFTLR